MRHAQVLERHWHMPHPEGAFGPREALQSPLKFPISPPSSLLSPVASSPSTTSPKLAPKSLVITEGVTAAESLLVETKTTTNEDKTAPSISLDESEGKSEGYEPLGEECPCMRCRFERFQEEEQTNKSQFSVCNSLILI